MGMSTRTFSKCVCVCACVCAHVVTLSVIKVIDSLGSITRLAWRQWHLEANAAPRSATSLTTGHVLGHFSNTDAIFSQTAGEPLTQRNKRTGRRGRGGGKNRIKRRRRQDRWGGGGGNGESLGIKEWNDEAGVNGQSKVRDGVASEDAKGSRGESDRSERREQMRQKNEAGLCGRGEEAERGAKRSEAEVIWVVYFYT